MRSYPFRRRRRRAFALTMALTLMVLVGVALAALTARVGTVARQSLRDRERSQAEELVLAGMEMARKNPAATTVELPTALREAGASLKLTPREGRVVIDAAVGKTRMTQEVEVTDGAVRFAPAP